MPCVGLHHGVEPRSGAQRPVLTEPRDAAVDNIGPHRRRLRIADAELVGHARREVLDHHVSGLQEPQCVRPTGVTSQVDDDAGLVAVEGEEDRAELTVVTKAAGPPSPRPLAVGRLDLDDLGPEIGQHHRAHGTSGHRSERDDS